MEYSVVFARIELIFQIHKATRPWKPLNNLKEGIAKPRPKCQPKSRSAIILGLLIYWN